MRVKEGSKCELSPATMNAKLIKLALMGGAAVGLIFTSGCALNESIRTPGTPSASDNAPPIADQHYFNIEDYVLQNEPQQEDRGLASSMIKRELLAPGSFENKTAYIEFDEQGDFFDRSQLIYALNNIPTSPHRLVVIYVHGWQNNSESEDVSKFNDFVAHLNRTLYLKALRDAEQGRLGKADIWSVYGVYISWRGSLLPPSFQTLPHNDITGKAYSPDAPPDSSSMFSPLPQDHPRYAFSTKENDLEYLVPIKYILRDAPKVLSFWSRAAAANRFAGGPLVETINSIAYQTRMQGAGQAGDCSRVMLIGHSFGAYVIEKTILQDYGALLTFPNKSEPFRPPIDFVVLLNSAAPSIYSKQLIDLLKWRHVGNPKNPALPLIVSVSSETDSATEVAFPAGTIAASLFDIGSYQNDESPGFNGANEKIFFTHTPGHSGYLASYDAVPVEEPSGKIATENKTNEWLFSRNINTDPSAYADMHLDPHSRDFLAWGDNGYGKTTASSDVQRWTLQPTQSVKGGEPYNQTPYWIVRVPAQIIDGHTDIWCPNSVNLVSALFRMSGLMDHNHIDFAVAPYPKDPAKGRMPSLNLLQDYPKSSLLK